MSVGLGTLKAIGGKTAQDIYVSASNYDADTLRLDQTGDPDGGVIDLDSRQMQELSIIIDRFLDLRS